VRITDIPFSVTNWPDIERLEYPGETGIAYWQTQQFGSLRLRMVEYSKNYLADHWCKKGHILLVLEGKLIMETPNDGSVDLEPYQSWQVADDTKSHRVVTEDGATVFIVD